MKEELRRKSKPMDQKKNCESQTGFTTDSGKGNKNYYVVRNARFVRWDTL